MIYPAELHAQINVIVQCANVQKMCNDVEQAAITTTGYPGTGSRPGSFTRRFFTSSWKTCHRFDTFFLIVLKS